VGFGIAKPKGFEFQFWIFINGKGLNANGKWFDISKRFKEFDSIEIIINRVTGAILFFSNHEKESFCYDTSNDLIDAEIYPIAVTLEGNQDFIKSLK